MANLDSITNNSKFKTLSSCRIEPILVLCVFIIFVNILTSKSATVETSQLARHRNVLNDQDLEEKLTHNEQYAVASNQINQSHPTSVKLPIIADSTSDIQSRLSSSTLESIVLSHNEPDLDNRVNSSDTNRNNSNQSPIKNVNLSNRTFTTTPRSIEDDEELRNYLQPMPDLVDETTTFPSFERVDKNVSNSRNDIEVSNVNTTTTTLTATTDSTLNVSQSSKFPEARFKINHSDTSNTTQFPILTKASSEQVAQFERRQASLTTRPNDIDKQSEIKPFFGKNSPIPQLKDSPNNSSKYQRAPSNPSLPNASLAELLYIIRHLNLSSGRSNFIDSRSDKSVRRIQQQQLKPVNWLQDEMSRRYNMPTLDRFNGHISQELNTAESSSNKVDQPILRKDSSEWGQKLKDEGLLKFKTGSLSSHKRISHSKDDNPKQLDRDLVLSKNSKYLLVSPYTGNFDSGISLKNFPLNKVIAPAKNPSMDVSSDNNQKFYDRFNKENLNDDSRSRKGPQSASTNIYYATDTTKPNEAGSNLSNKTSQGKLKIKSTVASKNNDKDDDVRSKRHERNSVDKKGFTNNESNDFHRLHNESKKISKSNHDEMGENIQTIRANHVRDNRRDSLLKDNQYENFKDDHWLTNHRTLSSPSSISPPLISPLPLPSFSSQSDYLSSLGVDKFPFHKFSDHQMDTLPSLEGYPFIGDAHRKSIYHIQEKGLNFHDDLPEPLTVGELAHEHSGTPFRLRSPIGENYNIGSGGEFNLTQESNNYDDYLYLPYNRNQHQSDSTGFKFDDDLKKKLAIKTIEAITKDPDLSISLFDNINQLNQIPSSSNIPIQKLYPNLVDSSSSNNNQMPYYHSSNQASTTNPLPLNMLPVATVQDQIYANNPSNHDHLKKNSSSPINLVVSEFPYRWALSRMPDLIPIPLAATVPGYLIRLSNGQILAAALTNSFSIQGIQKGPHGYKNYLNHRLKRLIKTGSGQKQSTPYVTNHLASDSGISSIVLQAPQRFTNSNKESSRGGGLFSRNVLSQLGLIRSNQRSNSTTKEPSKTNKPNKHKLIKLTNSPSPAPSFTDQELASLPVASLNEPIFSFADESQLIETPDPYHAGQSTLAPIMTPEPAEMFQNDNTLALRAKLNQFLSLKNLFNEDIFGGTKKRRSPPGGFEPPTFWLTAKRASRLRHGGMCL